MDISLIAEKLTDLDFIPLATVAGEVFSVYCEFNSFSELSLRSYRLAYIREKFGENQYSSIWTPLYLRDKETLVFRLSDFAGMPRELQLKSRTARGDLIRLYSIEPSITGGNSSPEGTQQGIRGEYHAGLELNDLRLTRIDNTLTFNWGTGSPHIDVPADNFSVKWAGFIHVEEAKQYRFAMNKKLLYNLQIGGFSFQRNDVMSGSDSHHVDLPEGNTPLRLEIFVADQNASFNFKIEENGGLRDLTANDLRY